MYVMVRSYDLIVGFYTRGPYQSPASAQELNERSPHDTLCHPSIESLLHCGPDCTSTDVRTYVLWTRL